MTITPYYQRGGITIYCGDCREILPKLSQDGFDLILTDPPYPSMKGGLVYDIPGVTARLIPTKTIGDEWGIEFSEWLPTAERIARLGLIVFCSYHSVDSLPGYLSQSERVALAAWYKRNSPQPQQNVPHFTIEHIWYFKKSPGLVWSNLKTHYDIPMLQSGCFASERLQDQNGKTLHKTQKPEALMMELLKCCRPEYTVIDPFFGTGTTLVAAQKLGIRSTGIELSEEYCRVAVDRLRQPSFFSIADEPTKSPTTLSQQLGIFPDSQEINK